jgi:hypothetical protein
LEQKRRETRVVRSGKRGVKKKVQEELTEGGSSVKRSKKQIRYGERRGMKEGKLKNS